MTALVYDSSRFPDFKVETTTINTGENAIFNNPYYDKQIISKSIKTIGEAMKKNVFSPEFQDIYNENNSFLICDLGEVFRLYQYWNYKLPRIQPFYAIKCNPNIEIIKLLAKLGSNFDCASKNEMETIINLGIDPSRIIFSNPCKFNSHIKFANAANVNLTVFDNEDELEKIAKIHPNCNILLRIETDDKAAVVRLSTKYGASLSNVDSLITKAKKLKLNLVGVHFHCGSGNDEVDSIVKAIKDAKDIFEKAESAGFEMSILDIGGGFMINNNFDHVADALNENLDRYFPESSGVRIISEPGRFFPTTAFTLASNIIGKRGSFENNESPMIYINDGIYTNMNCILNDHYIPLPKVLLQGNKFRYYDEVNNKRHQKNEGFEISCWGQTCDSADFITKSVKINHPVNVGDWFFFNEMGAYTLAATTDFNGFNQRSKIFYISSEDCVRFNKESEDWMI